MFKMRCGIPNAYILDIIMYKMHALYTANPRITRLIRSEKSSRNTKTRKVNN